MCDDDNNKGHKSIIVVGSITATSVALFLAISIHVKRKKKMIDNDG